MALSMLIESAYYWVIIFLKKTNGNMKAFKLILILIVGG